MTHLLLHQEKIADNGRGLVAGPKFPRELS
jgi:hypothetical protein